MTPNVLPKNQRDDLKNRARMLVSCPDQPGIVDRKSVV